MPGLRAGGLDWAGLLFGWQRFAPLRLAVGAAGGWGLLVCDSWVRAVGRLGCRLRLGVACACALWRLGVASGLVWRLALPCAVLASGPLPRAT